MSDEFRLDATLRDRWRATESGHRFTFPDGWLQGRSVFGGLTGAAVAALGARQVGPDWALRTASVQLLRPVAGGDVDARAVVLREGKGTTFVEVRLAQAGVEVATASLVFVRPRAGSLEVSPAPPPPAVDPEALRDLPYVPGVVPEFTRNVQMRWASGAPPFAGSASTRFDGYCRFRVPAGDAEGLLAMLDVWPSPSLGMLSKPAFASTVTWTAHLVAAPARHEGWFHFEYEVAAGSLGFHTVVGRLFAPDGTLAGWTEQLVALFD